MNQTEQTTVSAAWEQNTIFQEVEKLEICKWRDLRLGDYKLRDVEDRGISKLSTDGRVACRKTRRRRESLRVGVYIIDIRNEASKQNKLCEVYMK